MLEKKLQKVVDNQDVLCYISYINKKGNTVCGT
jgi:hypothetical protein